MIISVIDRDKAIMENILTTLSQIKQGGVANQRLVIDKSLDTTVTVSFYVDAAKTNLLFTVNNTDYPASFSSSGGKTFFVPNDEWINFAPAVSETYSQAIYYWTAAYGDATILTGTYANSKNLLFESVKVYTKPNPPSLPNEDIAYLVPSKPHETLTNSRSSDDRVYVVLNWDLYVSLTSTDCGNDEVEAVKLGYTVSNLVRNALYTDRYRDHNCTTLSADLNGTNISPLVVMPGDGYFMGMMKVQCVYTTSSTEY